MPLCDVPVVILHEILDHISTPVDLSNLALTSKWLQNLASPRLYRRLEFTLSSTSRTIKFCACLLLTAGRVQDWRYWTRSVHVSDEVREGSSRRGTVWEGLTRVLDGLSGRGLEEFEWDSRDVPPPMIITSLLSLGSLRSLKFEMPLGSVSHEFLERLAIAHAENLRSMHIWGIQNDAQMSRVGRTVGFATHLRDLSLCVAADCDWDDEPSLSSSSSSSTSEEENGGSGERTRQKRWMTLPQDLRSTLSSIELNGMFNLRDSSPFFNPTTLRRLELRQCTGYNSLLHALSAHPDIHNMEEVVLGSWENCDIARVSEFVSACPRLKILLLSLSSRELSHEDITARIMPAVETCRETLEVLLLDFRHSSASGSVDRTLYLKPRWLASIRTFPGIRELGISIDLTDLACLPEISVFLPPDVRVLDLRFPWHTMDRDRGARPAQVQALIDAAAAAEAAARLKLVIVGDGDDYGLCTSFEVIRDLEREGTSALVVPACGPSGSMVAGCDLKLYRLRGDCFFI